LISYNEALALYLEKRGFKADKHWKALLYLAPSNKDLSEIIWPYINISKGEAGLMDIDLGSLSSGQRILVQAAREFYNWSDSFKLSEAADTLDEEYWGTFLRAISSYRGNGDQ